MFNKKYIMTPDAKPLYAMVKCCGPQMGPLRKPTPVPLDIIKDILMQVNAPTIYEVIPLNNQLTKYSTPVRLTLDNYRTSYDEILAPKVAKELSEEDMNQNVYEINPTDRSPIQTDSLPKIEEIQSESPSDTIRSEYTEEEMEILRQMEEDENA